MTDLTQAEIDFFATGELPPELEAQLTPPAPEAAPAEAAPAAPESAPTPNPAAAAPAPNPAPESDATLLQRFLEEEQARRADLEAKLTDIQQRLAERSKPATPEVVVPDENEDPLGAMMHQLKQVNAQVTALETKLTTEQQNNLMKQQFDAFTASVRTAKEAFETITPDFKDAYAHIRNLRTEDLKATGVPAAEIPKMLLQDEFQLAQTAIARGKNPAEEMYAMAKRYGYAPKAAASAAAPTAAERLAQLRQGQAAARNPATASPETELTLEGIKDASNSDLNKLVQDDRLWAKIVGGQNGNDIF